MRAEHVVVDTDYPRAIGDIGAAVASVRSLALPPSTIAEILGDTADRLFPRLSAKAAR